MVAQCSDIADFVDMTSMQAILCIGQFPHANSQLSSCAAGASVSSTQQRQVTTLLTMPANVSVSFSLYGNYYCTAARASPGQGAAGAHDTDDGPVLQPMRQDIGRRAPELVRAGLPGHVHGQVRVF